MATLNCPLIMRILYVVKGFNAKSVDKQNFAIDLNSTAKNPPLIQNFIPISAVNEKKKSSMFMRLHVLFEIPTFKSYFTLSHNKKSVLAYNYNCYIQNFTNLIVLFCLNYVYLKIIKNLYYESIQ